MVEPGDRLDGRPSARAVGTVLLVVALVVTGTGAGQATWGDSDASGAPDQQYRASSQLAPAGGPSASTAGRSMPGGGAAGGQPTARPGGTGELRYIDADARLSLTPATPGSVDATLSFALPDNVGEFAVQLGDVGSVTATEGFTASGGEYVWDGETRTPTLHLRVRANRSTTRSPEVVESGYVFVDVGSWAIVPVPRFRARWSWTGGTVRLAREVSVAGEGATGGSIAYLGPHETGTRTAHGQELRLVVPRAATLAESRSAVLDELAWSSGRLALGGRDPQVTVVAAPRTVDWGVSGLQLGESDAWVVADSRLDTPDNVWLHEYVHTRQDLATTNATRWLVEATANYYAALLTYERGHIPYEALRGALARGTHTPVAGAVLAEPETWPSVYVPYEKGMLVAGALDRRLRLATDGAVTLERVVGRLNADDRLEGGEFVAVVRDLGGAAAGDAAQSWVHSSAVPETWSRAAHATAFERDVTFRYEAVATDALAVRGPYRTTTMAAPATLVRNETLAFDVRITNTGTAAGPYNATLAVNGTIVAGAAGTLAAGASTVVTVSHTFETAGHYDVRVGGTAVHVLVRPPADLAVTARTVEPPSPTVGEPVTLRVGLANDADRPGERRVVVSAGGERLASERVRLLPGESATVTATTTFDSVGEHTVTLAGASRTVSVAESTTATTTRPAGPGTGTPAGPGGPLPGFGVALGLVALAAAALLARRQGG